MTNKIFIAAAFTGVFALNAAAQKPQKAVTLETRTSTSVKEVETRPSTPVKEAVALEPSPAISVKEQAFKNWAERDVLYLITPREKEVYVALKTDRDREQFIEDFWRRRDPKPKTATNEFRDEYYARIAYANEHFPLTPGSITGWQSDRGKTYILLGAPDQVEEGRSSFAGAGDMAFEKWTYVNQKMTITFIDPAGEKEFRFLEKGSENLLGIPSVK